MAVMAHRKAVPWTPRDVPTSRWRRNAIILLGLLGCLLSSFALRGCGRQDVTADPKYWGGHIPGATYRLLVDAQYFKDNGGFIITQGTYNGRTGDLVPKGVRVQLDRIELKKGSLGGDQVYYMAHFVDGPFAGSNIDLGGITMGTADGSQRNPKVLELMP